MMIFQVLRFHL